MQVAITGGNGFIGRILVQKHLAQGDSVRVLSRYDDVEEEGVEVVVGDLTQNGNYLGKLVNGVDVIYHCAGEVSDQDKMSDLHIDGTRRLAEAAKKRVGRWVQLSSVGAYGPCRSGVVTEQTPEAPVNTYEATKTKSDNIVKQSGIPYVILRPSIVFGETMTNQSLFQMLKMIGKGLFFYIGKPGATANYVHVDDVVEALYLCATDSRAAGKIFNLSQTTSIESMVAALMAGGRLDGRVHRLPYLPVQTLAVLFGWLPGFPLTRARVAALTGRCRYTPNRIEQELGFVFRDTLDHHFRVFGENACN
jgi:nucleoside-diphosphate-sugar epimerase